MEKKIVSMSINNNSPHIYIKNRLYFYIVAVAFLFYSNCLFSQTTKEIKKMENLAKDYFSNENYSAAYPLLEKLHNSASNEEIIYMLAIAELKHKKNYAQAINYLESIQINSKEENLPVELHHFLGDAYHYNYDFNNAIKNYNKYLNIIEEIEDLKEVVDRKIEISNYAKQLYNNPKDYDIINLGSGINSEKDDYAPVISSDETILIFTSRRPGGVNNENAPDGEPYEDIYVSEKQLDNFFGDATLMSGKVNSLKHDATASITADGQKLFIYRSGENSEGLIYESDLKGLEWTDPKPLGKNINSKDWVGSVSVTPDEQTLYFSSNREGGIGGKDIYVSYKQEDGTWGKAKNLGPTINTIYDEDSPFIHPDSKTLFFSSKGHNTMGDYDIFKTVTDGTNWEIPENLGYPLNSTKADLHFVLSANGNNGYYTSSTIDGYGGADIYKILMPEANIPLTMIRGSILCADSLKPLNVMIQLKDVETGKFVKHVYRPNPETGKYLIILPPGKNYDLIVTNEGYMPYKVNVYIPKQKEFYELYQTIYLKAVNSSGKQGQGISIDNSFFNDHGAIVDMGDYEKEEILRQKQLQDLLYQIIDKSDSLAMNNLDETIETNFATEYKTIGIDNSFNSLLNLVGQVIENTDSIALKHLDNIVDRGFYTYAEENIQFYEDVKDTIEINASEFKIDQPIASVNDNSFDSVIEEKNQVPVPDKKIESKPISFSAILFDFDAHVIKKEYLPDLKRCIETFNDHSNMGFLVTGHTDNLGSNDYNIQLSKRRALAVQHYLIDNGIAPDKIKMDWQGKKSLLNENTTEEEKAENRRVEIKLISTNEF